MRLLCDAIAFCYGPSTALKRVLEVWRSHVTSITLVGTGTTREFFSRNKLVDEFIELDTEEPQELSVLANRQWDVFLSICNPIGFQYLAGLASVSVYWDFLLWMRSDGGAPEFRADYYVVEMYPGSDEAVGRWRREIPELRECPVLADWIDPIGLSASDLTLVNLGGQRSKLVQPWTNSRYPAFMVEQLQQVDDELPHGRFLVTADEATACRLAADYKKTNWIFLSLSHDEFLAELSRAERVITHPGLYSPFESIGRAKPTFFLPSSNYTQILQLSLFRRLGIAPRSIDWVDLLGRDVAFGLPEGEGIRQVLKLVEDAEVEAINIRLRDEFRSWLGESTEGLHALASAQRLASFRYFGNFKKILVLLIKEISSRINLLNGGLDER
jgi:hypothetical protein